MKNRYLFTTAVIAALAMNSAAHAAPNAKDFVNTASIANEFEIESSKLAIDRSKNASLRSFAQKMVSDHKSTARNLKDALSKSKANATATETLDEKHSALLSSLKSAPDAEFDGKYISAQTDAHKEAVDLFADYAANGEDATLKEFAKQTLPHLKEHLSSVEELAK